MRRLPEDPEREQRIIHGIVVDAYTPEDRAIGWHVYLKDHLHFPFRARCTKLWHISPVRKGEEVTVVGIAPEGECWCEMFVLIEWCGRTLGVPLAQLEGVDADEETAQALADWHYWVARGYQF